MLFRRSILLIFLVTGHLQIKAQNLVMNPSFEEVKDSAKVKFYHYNPVYEIFYMSGNLENSVSWNSPTSGTADLVGFKTEGVARTGMFIVWGALLGSHYEYLQGSLSKSLQKGKSYLVEIHVKSYDTESFYYPAEIGVMFTQERVFVFGQKNIDSLPDMVINISSHKDSIMNWVTLKDTLVADGGELFFTIGNFKSPRNSTVFYYGNNSNNSQLLLYDDISVIPLFADSTDTLQNILDMLQADKSIILKNILFEKDKSELLTDYNKELDRIAEWLNNTNTIRIIVSGYTDDDGTDEYNIALSSARAMAVKNYLTAKGIDAGRIEIEGYGKKHPIADNKTEEGKAMNRRIELKIINR